MECSIKILHLTYAVVRMAERSKAPDSRLITFPVHNGSGRSGLRMDAWVGIPLLTMSLFFSIFFLYILLYELPRVRVTKGSSNRGFELRKVLVTEGSS